MSRQDRIHDGYLILNRNEKGALSAQARLYPAEIPSNTQQLKKNAYGSVDVCFGGVRSGTHSNQSHQEWRGRKERT